MSVQFQVKTGDRVVVRISKENLAFGTDKVYPQGGAGTVIDYIDKKGRNHGCVNFQGMAYVKLDVPFTRTALLEEMDSDGAGKKEGPKFRIMTEMWIPTWILEYETKH